MAPPVITLLRGETKASSGNSFSAVCPVSYMRRGPFCTCFGFIDVVVCVVYFPFFLLFSQHFMLSGELPPHGRRSFRLALPTHPTPVPFPHSFFSFRGDVLAVAVWPDAIPRLKADPPGSYSRHMRSERRQRAQRPSLRSGFRHVADSKQRSDQRERHEKAPYHFTATTALMNFLLFVALTLLHTKPSAEPGKQLALSECDTLSGRLATSDRPGVRCSPDHRLAWCMMLSRSVSRGGAEHGCGQSRHVCRG